MERISLFFLHFSEILMYFNIYIYIYLNVPPQAIKLKKKLHLYRVDIAYKNSEFWLRFMFHLSLCFLSLFFSDHCTPKQVIRH